MKLNDLKCVACRGDEPPLTKGERDKYLSQVDNWDLTDNSKKIKKKFSFKKFVKAMEFVNKVADVSEEEGHHPDICVYDYNHVRIELWTHKIGGLHKNDFILASKIDNLLSD